jgi:arginyl-tRNA synthetase
VTPEELSLAISACLKDAVAAGEIALSASAVPDEVRVERPKNRDHGDWATNIALQLAKQAGTNPREFATILSARLKSINGVSAVDIAGPGFLNITVSAGAQGKVAADVVEAGASYGRSETLAGTRINVEFISANPTGPLHLGHTRWAAVGDAIARVLEAAGAEVTREFYINDRGSQMEKLALSVQAAALGRPVPDDGYHGDYIGDLARQVPLARQQDADRTVAVRHDLPPDGFGDPAALGALADLLLRLCQHRSDHGFADVVEEAREVDGA